jgi:nicotinamidase-related amidase
MDLSAYLRHFSAEDLEVMVDAGYGGNMGFGLRPALMVIDVAWAFCGDKPEPLKDSVKRWPNSCGLASWSAISRIQTLLEAFRCRDWPVIYTTGSWRDDRWDMGSWLWKHTRSRQDDEPVVYDRDPNAIVSAVEPASGDLIILKQKPSAFFGTPLQSQLTLLNCDSLIFTGGTTSGCVRASVVDAFSANYKVAVVADGCFDRNETSHAVNLVDMSSKYADIVSAQEVLNWMNPEKILPIEN